MQIEKEVNRIQRKNFVNSSQTRQGTRQSRRIRTNNKAIIDNKSKANTVQEGQKVAVPSKKAVNAALKAMTKAGFDAPNGMKMIVSFAPVNTNSASGRPNSHKRDQNQNQQRNKQQQRNGRGGGRRGGR